MKSTRLTKLLGIKYPIIQGGMVWVSGYKLASSVSNEGGLGVLGAGSMKPELLKKHIVKCKSNTNKPFAVNLPIFSSYSQAQIEIIIEEKVAIVITSAGSPKKYTQRLKEAGIIVGHVVPSVLLAKKCEDAGVDFIVAEGFEAGGHNGRDETTTLCLIPQIKEAIQIPFAAAGGIANGSQVLACLAMGADGVQIGTKFACSKESSAHENYKDEIIKANESHTALVLKSLMPVRIAKTNFYDEILIAEKKGNDLAELLGKGRAKQGIFEGNLKQGELEFGQISGLIKVCLSVQEIFYQLKEEYKKSLNKVVGV
ncbi:MAG: nitronate monooxygenase [Candidatus Cloacimonadota bacterium]|nr:MAG: nitronate monooxygenase [Candidatus Cloacimonadota bacterium]